MEDDRVMPKKPLPPTYTDQLLSELGSGTDLGEPARRVIMVFEDARGRVWPSDPYL
jgi:hypothetical protein